MIGIVLISHGKMAEGVLDAAKMFISELPYVETVSLGPQDSPEAFAQRLKEAVEKAENGDGVVIVADLKGGTPCNQAAFLTGDRVRLLAGMNLPLVMELLMSRENSHSPAALTESALALCKDQIVDIGKLLGR